MTRKDRQEFNDALRRAAGAEAALEICREQLGLLRAEYDSDRKSWADERHALLERIQRPEHEPAPVTAPGPRPKLHFTEDDEIAGLTLEEVSADAGLPLAHRYAVAHVTELAEEEGLE